MEYLSQSKDNIFVAGHCGWAGQYPENTMEAFRAAVAVGVDQVETDIRITKDGEFVLIHDHTADRTTNGTGRIRDMTLKEVLSLDAGIKRGERFRGCRVPAFDEFLDYVVSVPGLTVDFELKEYPQDWDDDTAFRMCDRILKQIDDAGFTDRCVINTFSGELHEYIRDTYGNHFRQHVYFPCCNLGRLKRDPYQYAYCCCMFRGGFYNDIDLATKEECKMMASMGVQPWAGAGIRDERGVDAVIDRGCTLITCDNPDVILEILRKKGKHK